MFETLRPPILRPPPVRPTIPASQSPDKPRTTWAELLGKPTTIPDAGLTVRAEDVQPGTFPTGTFSFSGPLEILNGGVLRMYAAGGFPFVTLQFAGGFLNIGWPLNVVAGSTFAGVTSFGPTPPSVVAGDEAILVGGSIRAKSDLYLARTSATAIKFQILNSSRTYSMLVTAAGLLQFVDDSAGTTMITLTNTSVSVPIDFNVNGSKFTVAAASGNTSVFGTLSVTGRSGLSGLTSTAAGGAGTEVIRSVATTTTAGTVNQRWTDNATYTIDLLKVTGAIVGLWAQAGNSLSLGANGAEMLQLVNGGDVQVANGTPFKLGVAFVGGAPVATGYITVKDNTGTTYKLLAA